VTINDYAGGGITISPEAPDAMLAGLDVLRSIVQPAGSNALDLLPSFQWHLSGHAVEDEDVDALRIVGDLMVLEEGWFIGVTVAAVVQFRRALVSPPSTWSDHELKRQVAVYGPWVSHGMYDLATLVARQLGVQSHTVRVPVPLLTPEPTFVSSGGEPL
jgi:hypothetical protein